MNIAVAPVAPLSSDAVLAFLLQAGVLLAVAVVLGRLAQRMGLPAIVGELGTGVLLGPSVLGALGVWDGPNTEQLHLLDAAGLFGVLLLVGCSGTELDLRMVRKRGGVAAKISIGGLLIPLALGVSAGFVIPLSLLSDGADRTVVALFLGVAMCVSAIPVIAKTLLDMNLLHRTVGQLTLTASVIDDIFGWMMLSVVSAMATTGLRTGTVVGSVVTIVAVVLVAAFVVRPLARVALRRGPVLGTTVVIIILGAAGTQALDIEAVFGAFVCGVVIASVLPNPEALAPLRKVVLTVLAPLFFALAGLRMDLTALADVKVAAVAASILILAVVGKFLGAGLGALASGLTRWEALACAAGMNARGVIEVIVAMAGLRLGVLNSAAYTSIVLVAIVTSLMAPPVLRMAMKRVEHTAEEQLRLNWPPAQGTQDGPAPHKEEKTEIS
ncbi:cation:proton antiporter [Streptomyces sp. VRA16 Mangrove soil]|uniref:cation:proton antiporter n=1 Tax=Streptomyces sp. VRA16 Mangrove soil TaxID=2817434 RepID=UPI001A9D3204|nr:cation:proton antiporter [Streptomyces sp. VRA16 Mangrove soil]MBO1334087.1 cation:proton antiporter [Streptomyces sp. VRA16 Mangrove soil]